MAFGDIGGPVTELVLTCQTPPEGVVAIHKGDALKLTGAYTIDNDTDADEAVFGQALADMDRNAAAIPVKVRGVCIFTYTGGAPVVNGISGVTASSTAGAVKAPASGDGFGRNLKVNTGTSEVHVLL